MSTTAATLPSLDRRLTLYFGTDTPNGKVSGRAWSTFANDVILPTFPNGATLTNATGTYRMADGRAVREATHVLSVLYPEPETAAVDANVARIVDAYKTRFHQESVLDVRETVTGTFR